MVRALTSTPLAVSASRAAARLALVLALVACGEDNGPPSLSLLSDRQVQIGQTLVVPLTANDPDDDRLTFKVDGLPDSAVVDPRAKNEAVLVWSPLITDTQPGGRRYEVEVTASDSNGGRATQTFAIVVYPAFGVPEFVLPAGLVLNLASSDALELPIEVKDDDSLDVVLELVEGPDGARFQTTERKTGFFYWRPDDEQRKVAVHRAIFRATDDTNPPVTHTLTIVLLNAERQSGCEGTPPTLTHGPAADTNGSTLRLTATATDAQSQVQSLTVFWTRGPMTGQMTAAPMRRVAEGSTEWSLDLDVGAPDASGTLIHYHLVATDNDDPQGLDCDLSARLPRAGAFTAAVYPFNTPTSTCLDDELEPDDALALAPLLPPGLYAGRRLCGPNADLVAVDAAPGNTLTATLTFARDQGTPTFELIDDSQDVLTTAIASGASDGRLALRYELAPTDDRQLFFRISADTATRLSYTLEFAVGDAACEDDTAEPDSTREQARPLPLDQSASRRLCGGDEDFFALTLTPGQEVKLSLAFDHRYGDLDLELLDAAGNLISRSASERSLEEITHRPTASVAYARVYGVANASNDYVLTLSRSTSIACPSDGLGDNTSHPNAAVLFQGIYEGFKSCPDAPDWFAVDLNDNERLDVLILTDEGKARLEAYRDPTGAPIAVGEPDAEGFSELSLTANGQPERLYYRVVATEPPTGDGVPTVTYALLQDVVDPPGACLPDRKEPNAIGSPAALSEGIHTWLRHCGNGDTDVFRLTIPAFTTLVAITGHASPGYGDLELRDASGGLVLEEVDLGEGAYLEVLLEQPGDYTLYVKPFEVAGTLGYDLAIFFD